MARQAWTHAACKLRRAASMKVSIKDRKRDNIAVEFKRWKTASKRRGDYEMKIL